MERFQALEAVAHPTEHAELIRLIRQRADSMAVAASVLHRKIMPAEKRLGKLAPKGWYRAIVPKIRFLARQSGYNKAFLELEEEGIELDRLIGLINT